MNQPPISLQNLTPEEKEKIAELSSRKMVKGITLYLIPFAIFGFLVWYVNQHYMYLGLENADVRGWLNVVLVLFTLIPARLFVNVLLGHRKATNAWQKKVIKGKITAIDGRIITLVNQKVKISVEDVAKLKVENEVIVSALPSGDIILGVELIN